VRVVKKINLLVTFFFLISIQNVDAVQKGSNSAVSVQPFAFFPNTDTDNGMLAFGFFQNGFALQDATTSSTFSSIFPVSGQISLHGGKLFLGTDLIFQNNTNFATPGLIYGNNHMLELCQSITGIPTSFPACFDNTELYLNSDVTISGTIKFTGNCLIDGHLNGLMLGSNANIIVGHNSSLLLKNIDISGISGYKISCLDNSGALILNNVQWGQSGNYTFSSGSILFDNIVHIIGANTFNYASALTSTINSDSILHFGVNSIFSFGRAKGFHGQQPLALVDNTSVLDLDNCTVSITSSGATLTNGLILAEGEVYIDVHSTTSLGGLYLGNGQVANDILIELAPGAVISFVEGHFINNNFNTQNFFSANINKSFVRQSTNTFLYSNRSLYLSNINILNATNGQTILGPNSHLYFNNCYLTTAVGDFYVTGTRLTTNEYLLPGNGNVTITQGVFPLALAVQKTNNTLLGIGDMAGPLILQDGGTQILVQMTGAITSNISSAGSSIVLGRDLRLSKDIVITGSANVNLATNNLLVQMQSNIWTSTVVFTGNGGTFNLISDFPLASQITFKGDCTIQGNGNDFTMLSGGNIIVAPNSTLHIKNTRVVGMMGNNIRCNDDSSKIVFDNMHAVYNGNYSFTTGSLLVSNKVGFEGPYIWSYQTNITSTINQNAELRFDMGMTLSYDPSNQRQNLLNFTNASSVLCFDKSTNVYVGPGGLALIKGHAIFNHNVSIFVNTTAGSGNPGLSFGDNTSNDDVTVDILAGAVLDLEQGVMTYRNVQSSLWNMVSNSSILRLEAGTQLQLDQTLNVGVGLLQFSSNALLTNAAGKTIIGSTSIF